MIWLRNECMIFFGIVPYLVNLKFIWQLSGWIVLDEDFECLWNIIPYVPTHPHISQTTELKALLIVTYEALCDLSFSAFENAFLLPVMPFPNPLFANFDLSLSFRYYLLCSIFPDLPRLAICSFKCQLETTTQT